MSGIWIARSELFAATAETVGYKSGLALTRKALAARLPPESAPLWRGPAKAILRIRPEEFEQIVAWVLYRLGNLSSPSIAPPGIRLFHQYKGNAADLKIFMDIFSIWPEFLEAGVRQAETSGTKAMDPRPFVEESERRHGLRGAQIALELLHDLSDHFQRSPWSGFQRVEWKDSLDLQELFQNESLDTYYGSFIDQRFVDYLAQNIDDLARMNWRKFEGLACEYFSRLGFHTEIGPGRDDGNIDARVWPSKAQREFPPTLLIQCKRQKAKVDKVVVKALWADIVEEGAESGLIVTTSSLSPGAEKVCTARGYPIGQANRETLRIWVEAMRTPGSGIFLGE